MVSPGHLFGSMLWWIKKWPQILGSFSHQEMESLTLVFESGLTRWFALTNRMWEKWCCVTSMSWSLKALLLPLSPLTSCRETQDERPNKGWEALPATLGKMEEKSWQGRGESTSAGETECQRHVSKHGLPKSQVWRVSCKAVLWRPSRTGPGASHIPE